MNAVSADMHGSGIYLQKKIVYFDNDYKLTICADISIKKCAELSKSTWQLTRIGYPLVGLNERNHVNVDQTNKLIQCFELTDAVVHGGEAFDFLLNQAAQEDGSKRAAYADSARCSLAVINYVTLNRTTSIGFALALLLRGFACTWSKSTRKAPRSIRPFDPTSGYPILVSCYVGI